MRTALKLAVLVMLLPAVASRGSDAVSSLRDSLTHHASFDEKLEADFSRGDPVLYSYETAQERLAGGRIAQADSSIEIVGGAGRHGGALLRERNSRTRVFYRGAGVLNYREKDWGGSVSIWLRTNPDGDLPPGYCDPVQIMGESNRLGYIFLEWSRDHTPRKFRYAILPRTELWNRQGAVWDEMTPEQRPMIQIERAPFSRDRWTHVVFTFERINTEKGARGKLYIDGRFQGAIEGWDLKLGWSPEIIQLVLGAAYVGQMDDLAIFDHALSDEEVMVLHGLPEGAGSLYK